MQTITCRPNSESGFTLIEIAMVVAIVGVLAGLAGPGYLGYLDKARTARTIAEIRVVEKSVKAFYFSSSDVYPNTLAEVGAGSILDPWGTPYQYLNISGGALAMVAGVVGVAGAGVVGVVRFTRGKIAFSCRSIPTSTSTVWGRIEKPLHL
jgi:general secretion pathway protein G